MRDSQRQRVYNAEIAVRRYLDAGVRTARLHGSALTLPIETRFGRVEEAQAYVDRAAKTVGASSVPTVRVNTQLSKRAYYRCGEIVVPDPVRVAWAMREIVLLHELAHHLSRASESHGPEFCGRFIALVREMMAPELGLLLEDSMRTEGVRIDYSVI